MNKIRETPISFRGIKIMLNWLNFIIQSDKFINKCMQKHTRLLAFTFQIKSGPVYRNVERCRSFTGASVWYSAGGSATVREAEPSKRRVKAPRVRGISVRQGDRVCVVSCAVRLDAETCPCVFRGLVESAAAMSGWAPARVVLTSPAAERYWTKECSAGSLFK